MLTSKFEDRPRVWANDSCSGSTAPIDSSELFVTLERCLEKRRLEREKRMAEDALEESERQLRSLVENVPGVVYRRLMRTDGSVSFPYVGPQESALTGIDPEAVMRDPNIFLDRLHPEDRDAWLAAWEKSAKSLERILREVRIERGPGEYRWLRVRGVPHRLPNGDTLWDAISFDVTEEKQASEVRDRTFAALENLPVAKDEPKSPDNSRRAPRGFPTGTETVLVVEDQSQVQSFIFTVLRCLGYTVFDAANGSEAIALAVKAPTIDLVLTDLLLPGGMNGHEIARQVRKRIARTKVVYISGDSRGTVESGDPNTFLMKPFGRKALAETVRMALDTANA